MTHATLEIAPGAPQRHLGATVFPLLSLEPVELPYRLLEDAIAAEELYVKEIGEEGSVPDLLVVNEGEEMVLVLDGEQFIGAKQNRMASRTLLLPGHSATKIPVSCIERGRWRSRSTRFSPSRHHSPVKARKSVRDLEASMIKEGRAATAADLRRAQAKVWSEVDAYSEKLHVYSSTSALDEISVGAGAKVDDWIARFPAAEGQVGLLAFFEGRPLGLDVIGGRGLYAKLHDRLLRGYALDALEARAELRSGARSDREPAADPERPRPDPSRGGLEQTGAPDESDGLRFLDRLQRATRTPSPTVGSGEYFVLSETCVGSELVDGPRLAHRNAFEA